MDFDTAVLKSKEIKSASNDDKLALYKLFKQVGFARLMLLLLRVALAPT